MKRRLATFCGQCGAEMVSNNNGDVCGCGSIWQVVRFTRRKPVVLLPLFPSETPNTPAYKPRVARLLGELAKGIEQQVKGEK